MWPLCEKNLLSVTCFHTSPALTGDMAAHFSLTQHLLSAVTYLLLDLLIAWMCWLYLDTVHVQMYMHVYMVLWKGTRRYNSSFGRRCVSVTLKGHPGAVTNLSVLPLCLSLSFCLLLFKMKDLLWFTDCFPQGRQCSESFFCHCICCCML